MEGVGCERGVQGACKGCERGVKGACKGRVGHCVCSGVAERAVGWEGCEGALHGCVWSVQGVQGV